MIDKSSIIEQIESQLVQAEAATSDQAFEKHMYAIHALTSLVVSQQTSSPKLSSSSMSSQYHSSASSTSSISAEEMKLMGAKMPLSDCSKPKTTDNNTMITDDQIGNGDSIFDF